MHKAKNKILFRLAVYEVIFILILAILLNTIPHSEHEFIYFININLIFLVSVLGWISLKYGNSNKVLTALISIWFSVSTPYTIFFIFSRPNFSDMFNFINFHILYIYSTTYQLFLTLYLFFLSLFPQKRERNLIISALLFSLTISIINYLPIFISGVYLTSWDPLFSRSYNLHLLNFSLLVIFWHQYTKMKLIFSEYLPNILSIYTIIIGLEIFHNFSSQNELLFHYFAQYFNFLLYLFITGLFIARINYLLDPKSKTNENYIQNYEILHDFMDKPRRGIFIEFYSNLNRNTILIILGVVIFLGIYLFFFNRFTIFIRLNILLLILASIISLILAIITWHKRWYSAIGIFFKKKSN